MKYSEKDHRALIRAKLELYLGFLHSVQDEKPNLVCDLMELYLEKTVDIPRIKAGKNQTVETFINEEVLLLAKYIRGERREWIPRLSLVSSNG